MGKKLLQTAAALVVILTAAWAWAAPVFKQIAADQKYKDTVRVRPEGVTEVLVSTSDVNRIISDHVIFNIKEPEVPTIRTEIDTKGGGKNAFVQYIGKKPMTIYISTRGGMYTLRLKPARIGAQKIHLAAAVGQNPVAKLHGNQREKLGVQLIRAAYSKGKLLEKASRHNPSRTRTLIKGIIIKEHKRYDFNDDQLTLSVYIVKLADSFKYPRFKVSEKNFLLPQLAAKPVGIALSRDYLTKNDYVRLFILGES